MEVAIGAVDAIAARTIDKMSRCNSIWISSFELSTARGVPDAGWLNVAELRTQVMAVCRASTKPLYIDASSYREDDLVDLLELLQVTARPVSIVVDDTVWPRHNSFDPIPNRQLSAEATSERLNRVLSLIQGTHSATLCFRSERFSSVGSVPLMIDFLLAVLARLDSVPKELLVHGYDTVRLGLRKFREGLPELRFLTLSTLSPACTVDQFADAGVDVLVIPSLLTIQRIVSGAHLLALVLEGRVSVDGGFPPFATLLSDIQSWSTSRQ